MLRQNWESLESNEVLGLGKILVPFSLLQNWFLVTISMLNRQSFAHFPHHRSAWEWFWFKVSHMVQCKGGGVLIRPRPFNWGFRIFHQKLRFSSVHPMSCQLDQDKHNFEGKFGTINQKDEVWLRWGAPMLIGETRYLQTQFLAASWRVGIRELLPRGSFDCFIGSAIVGAAAVSRFRWRELLRRRHETLHAQFMT